MELARAQSASEGWLEQPPAADARAWLPPDDPARADALDAGLAVREGQPSTE